MQNWVLLFWSTSLCSNRRTSNLHLSGLDDSSSSNYCTPAWGIRGLTGVFDGLTLYANFSKHSNKKYPRIGIERVRTHSGKTRYLIRWDPRISPQQSRARIALSAWNLIWTNKLVTSLFMVLKTLKLRNKMIEWDALLKTNSRMSIFKRFCNKSN